VAEKIKYGKMLAQLKRKRSIELVEKAWYIHLEVDDDDSDEWIFDTTLVNVFGIVVYG
jgi:hypothetical protein